MDVRSLFTQLKECVDQHRCSDAPRIINYPSRVSAQDAKRLSSSLLQIRSSPITFKLCDVFLSTLQAIAFLHQAQTLAQSISREQYGASIRSLIQYLSEACRLSDQALMGFLAFIQTQSKTVWWGALLNPIMTVYRKTNVYHCQLQIDQRLMETPPSEHPLIRSQLQQETLQKFQTKSGEILRRINTDRHEFEFSKKQILIAAACNGIKLFSSYTTRLHDSLFQQISSEFPDSAKISKTFPKGDVTTFFFLAGKMALGNRSYDDANHYLTRCLSLLLSYPTSSHSPAEQQTATYIKQYNLRQLWLILAPLRLYYLYKYISVPAQTDMPYSGKEQLSFSANILDTGCPSPSFLSQLDLPIHAMLARSIFNGNVLAYQSIVTTQFQYLVKNGIYFLVQQLQSIVWLRLLQKVYSLTRHNTSNSHVIFFDVVRKALQYQESSAFTQSVQAALGSPAITLETSNESIECIVANLIFNKRIRGYIAQSRGLVLSKKGDPFSF